MTRVCHKSLGQDLWIEWHFSFDPILFMLEGTPLIFSGTLQIKIKTKSFVVIGDGAVIIAFAVISVAAIIIGFRVLPVESNGLTVIGDGAVIIAFAVIGGAAVDVGVRVFRVKADGLTVIGYGAVIIALVVISVAAVDVGVRGLSDRGGRPHHNRRWRGCNRPCCHRRRRG